MYSWTRLGHRGMFCRGSRIHHGSCAKINMLAQSMFGDSFWDKKRAFACPNAAERPLLLANWPLETAYFDCRSVSSHLFRSLHPWPPSVPIATSSEVQLVFKKLITASKTFLTDESARPTGCFCQDCIAELEVCSYGAS